MVTMYFQIYEKFPVKISIGTIGCRIQSLEFEGRFWRLDHIESKNFSLLFYRKLIQGYLATCTGRVTDMLDFDKFVFVITLSKLVFHHRNVYL